MEAVAGDLGSLQFLGQLMGEEYVAQLAIGVDLKNLHGRVPQSQGFMGVQAVKIYFSKVVCHRRQDNHSARFTLLQPVQQ